jgi:hypothetical protein
MPAENIPDDRGARQRLMDLHGGSSWVSKHACAAFPLNGLHQDVTPFPRLIPISVVPLRSTCAGKPSISKMAIGSCTFMTGHTSRPTIQQEVKFILDFQDIKR